MNVFLGARHVHVHGHVYMVVFLGQGHSRLNLSYLGFFCSLGLGGTGRVCTGVLVSGALGVSGSVGERHGRSGISYSNQSARTSISSLVTSPILFAQRRNALPVRELFLADGKLVTEVAQVLPAAWLSTHGHGGRISERAAASHGAYRERRQSARPLHRVEGLAVIEATPDGAQRVIATSAIWLEPLSGVGGGTLNGLLARRLAG